MRNPTVGMFVGGEEIERRKQRRGEGGQLLAQPEQEDVTRSVERDLTAVHCPMCDSGLVLSEEEVLAVADLSQRLELSPAAVWRQALRTYQLHVLGEPELSLLAQQVCTCAEYETCPVHEGDGAELFQAGNPLAGGSAELERQSTCVRCGHNYEYSHVYSDRPNPCSKILRVVPVSESQLAALHQEFRDEAGVERCGCKCESPLSATQESNLLPCPFCGATNKQGYAPLMIIDGEVHCAGCGARGGTVDGTLRTAADRWNTRALQPEVDEP